jgi:hypothetical protein
MREIKTELGPLKYRMPNLIEIYDLLDKSDAVANGNRPFKIKREFIKNMSDLVDFSAIEGVSSYDELLLKTDEMANPLSQIADEVFIKVSGIFEKKA